MAKKRSTHKPLTAHSRMLTSGFMGNLDLRSAEGRFLIEFEAQLTAHVGGDPTWPQKVLIHRAAVVALRLHLFDVKYTDANFGSAEFDHKAYNAACTTLKNLLRELGLKRAPQRGKTLSQHLDAMRNAPAAAPQP